METYEQLGAFYLGRVFDPSTSKTLPEALLYDAKDLTTHALCVGMTGSGKTGLCVSLLEEAAMDGIPALIIDPKGDLGNMLLTFPELRAEDFAPWIDPQEAARKGETMDSYSKKIAARWRKGLADWDQPADRIARLKQAAEVAVYTPGNSSGRPLSVLRSLDAPKEALRTDTTAMRDRIMSAVSGLLGLLGITGDPITSREHILLSTLLDLAWKQGENLELTDLIHRIQKPPFDRVGVFDLETFYPAGDRLKLAMMMNNLLVSPGFSAWMSGEPLNIQNLLYTPAGKPRHCILSIAHLSDAERMFFVTTVLNEMLAWMRSQPGTSSLRALLYMDEIYGYFPPTANPPSKVPMLTLLKQARAYGVGVVLATQNPVDLDYKGLSNCGTWFIGRLQTDRDKARILDGLESSGGSGGFDRARMENLISSLDSRVFLMRNVHDKEPVLLQTRWAMSYLRGPMTLSQIKTFTRPPPAAEPAPAAQTQPAAAPEPAENTKAAERPVVPAHITELFLTVDPACSTQPLTYRPAACGVVRLHYALARAGLDTWPEVCLLAPLDSRGEADWESAARLAEEPAARPAPVEPAAYDELPAGLSNKSTVASWEKMLKSHAYADLGVEQLFCRPLKAYAAEDESESEFVARLQLRMREERDLAMDKLKTSFGKKLDSLEKKIQTAENQLADYQGKVREQGMSTVISIGGTILGALLGRRSSGLGTVGRASTAMRSAGRISGRREKVAQAKEKLAVLQADLEELESAFETEKLALMDRQIEPEIERIPVHPRKTDIMIRSLVLAWVPWIQGVDGRWTNAARIQVVEKA
jgi:hypothetical protein